MNKIEKKGGFPLQSLGNTIIGYFNIAICTCSYIPVKWHLLGRLLQRMC